MRIKTGQFENVLELFAMNTIIEFIFPRRLHRFAYFLRGMVLSIVTGFLNAHSTTSASLYWGLTIVALGLYSLFFITLPRIRDIGMSGWWLLVIFNPVADVVFGIILMFRPPNFLTRPNPNQFHSAVTAGVAQQQQ